MTRLWKVEIDMKRKQIVICALVAIVVVVGVLLLLRPKALGNITASYDEPETSASEVSFAAEKGERVKFSFRSDIKAGELEIVVYDSTGNEIYVLDHAKALETFYTFENSDTYTLRAEYSDFIGNFKIAVYPAK